MAEPLVVERRPASSPARDRIFRAGAARRDITPALGTTLSGYGSIRSEASARMCGRLFATAVVLDDGHGERVALVSLDLHAGTRYLAELAAARLAPSTGIDIAHLYLAATHTHSGPGHVYGNTLYDGMTAQGRGLDPVGAERIVAGVVAAVEEAVQKLRAAKLGHGLKNQWGYSMNRSLDAFAYDGASPTRFAAGFGAPPGLPEASLAVDPRLQVLWAETLSGEPIGAFATFGVHATAIASRHATLSSDLFGSAVRAAQDRFARAGLARPTIALAAGTVGDSDLDLNGAGTDAMVARQGVELASELGEILGEVLESACLDARARASSDVRLRALFDEPQPAGAWVSDGRRLGIDAAYGLPAMNGSELGRNFAIDAKWLAGALTLEGRRGRYDAGDPHAPKLTTLRSIVARITGRPAQVLPLRVVDATIAGRRATLVGLPGEPTARFASAVERTVRDRGASAVMITAVTGDYAGYLTTEKEYELQHYEGACTIWGRATLGFVIDRLRELEAKGSPPLAKLAQFEQDDTYAPPGRENPGPRRVERPIARAVGPAFRASWTAPVGLIPDFAPLPWVALEELRGDAWTPLVLAGREVDDQSRPILIERTSLGDSAVWTAEYRPPHELHGRPLRMILLAKDFGGPVPSTLATVYG